MAFTIREYLGDEKIAQLESMGFLPSLITDMAKRQYMQDRQAKRNELADSGLDGKLVQGIMRGEISEEEARNAQKFEDFGAKKHGWGLGAVKTVAGVANAAERVSDLVNPFYEGKRDEKGDYVYQNAIEKGLRPKIKSAEKLRNDYEKATGETSWGSRVAEIGTEMIADPINFVGGMGLLSKGSKLAQFGKKSLYFAGTGAASGGVMALGEGKNDEETLKNMGYGAAGGLFLGHLIDQGTQGIGELIAKRRASKAANEADAIEHAENSEFIGGGDARSGGDNTGSLEPTSPQSVALTVVRSVLKNEPLLTREQVLKEILSGAEKSSVIKPEKYKSILNSINEYKSYQNTLRHVHDNPDEVKNADLIFGQMQDNFIRANEDNTKKYYDAAPLFGRELKTAQTMTAREFATGEAGLDEATAAKVIKEAAQGKEKSDFVDADTYADIVKFKNFENQRDYARAYGEQIEAAKQSLNNAREQSAVRYAETQRAISEYQKQGMSPNAIRELINAKFKPGADEINYTRAYNDGADVDPRLAGQGIFYAIEKDIAAYKYTPGQYFARLENKGYGDEQATVLTQAYAKKDINIAKEYVNGKAAEAYEEQIRKQVAAEIKARNEVEGERAPIEDANSFLKESAKHKASERERMSGAYRVSDASDGHIMKDGGAAKQYAEHKFEVQKWINDLSGVLSDEWIANLKSLALKHPEMFKSEADVFRVIKEIKDNPTHFFKNNRDDAALIAKELKDGKARNIVIKKDDGRIVHVNKTRKSDIARLQRNNEKALEETPTPSILDAEINPAQTRRFATTPNDEIISQKGNLVNETETNGLRDSVSSIGDNASRAGGRQASDEQILRQGRRDTANASQTKRPAQSDEQVERQWAAKADSQTNAAATTKQVVEKQGGGASIGGGLTANSNAHLGSGLVSGTLNSVDEDGNFSPERFAAGFLAGLAGSKAVATGLRKMTPKLYNQILGAAEKMPQMANSNPRLLGRLYSNGKDVSLNSFAGEKAITANVGKLDQAKAMLEKGADEVEIWQKTGWFKDKDGAWKFEIGDSNAKLNPNFQSGGRLGELLEHEELFKAYPELKDVRVVKIGGETPSGAALSVKDAAQREKRGIYNVTYNDKTATLVKHDLDSVESALKYTIGNKDKGAKHINIRHMKDESAEGYVTQNELLNVGKNMREYLAKFKEPFINKRNARIYEWQGERGVRFRLVASNKSGEGRGLPSGKSRNLSPITNDLRPAANEGLDPNGSLEEIITFYSDRNLKDRMNFENPKVKYDVNLSEWHKDSAPVTKNADGSPKVFYHGSLAKDITEFKSEFDNSGIGFWFADKDYAANHGEGNLYETFLRIKNPLDLREENAKYPFELMRKMQRKGLSLEPYGKTSKEAKEFLKQNGYDGIVLDGDYKERPFVIAFDSAQIKHVKNDGNFSDSPNIYKSWKEGYYSPAKNEIGLRDIGDKSTLMHEVQHAIQEIEDFARGGSRERIEGLLWYESGRLAYDLKKLAPPPEFYVLEKKRTTLSSKLFQAQDKVIEQNPLMEDNIIDNIVDKKSIDELKLKNTKELNELKDVLAEYRDTNNALDDMLKNHPIFKERKKISDKLDALVKKDPYEEYKKLLGEVEARNVQNRLNLDGKAHPHETFDVNPNETIVSKGGEVSYSRKVEEIKREHPNVEKELDESIAAMRKESFNDSNFKAGLISKFDTKEITTQELGKSVNLSDKQLAVLKNDIKNADFKVINESKIYFDKMGKDGDKKRFFVDIAEDGSLRVDAYAKSQIDNIPVKQSALEELADVGDKSRLKNMSFEVKAAYRNELDPIKKEAILKTAELNKLKKAAQSGDKAAAAKFEEFKAKNLDENGNIKDGLSLC